MDHLTRIAERVEDYGYGLLITDVPPIQDKAISIDNKGAGYKASGGKIYDETIELRNKFKTLYFLNNIKKLSFGATPSSSSSSSSSSLSSSS